ncbi:MAG: hypothetical protein KC621_32030, partial [Myxococcales bacterium]|nr:hypothetical protein [Myxococcales bacterium]
ALTDGVHTELLHGGAPLHPPQTFALLLARTLVGTSGLVVVDGLLDGVSDAVLERFLLARRRHPSAPTLVVLTEDAELARRFDRTLWLHDGGLHERPPLRSL